MCRKTTHSFKTILFKYKIVQMLKLTEDLFFNIWTKQTNRIGLRKNGKHTKTRSLVRVFEMRRQNHEQQQICQTNKTYVTYTTKHEFIRLHWWKYCHKIFITNTTHADRNKNNPEFTTFKVDIFLVFATADDILERVIFFLVFLCWAEFHRGYWSFLIISWWKCFLSFAPKSIFSHIRIALKPYKIMK